MRQNTIISKLLEKVRKVLRRRIYCESVHNDMDIISSIRYPDITLDCGIIIVYITSILVTKCKECVVMSLQTPTEICLIIMDRHPRK